jgi:hypothetical protein
MVSKWIKQSDANLRQLDEVKARLNIAAPEESDPAGALAWGEAGRRCAHGCPSPMECKEALSGGTGVPNLEAFCPNASLLLGKAENGS